MSNIKRTINLIIIAVMLMSTMTITSVGSQTITEPKLNKSKVTLKTGNKYTLKLKGVSKKKIKWTTSKKKIATVKNGKVTAKKAGKTTITAKYKNKKFKCKVTVKKVKTNKKAKQTNTINRVVKNATSTVNKNTVVSKKPTVATKPSYNRTPNEMELEILRLVNKHRADAGRKPLTFGYFYYDCAIKRAEECDVNISHTRLNGTKYSTVFAEYGVDKTYRYSGENVAQYFYDAESVVTAFMNSEGHRKNILCKDYDYLAVAVLESDKYPNAYTIV